MSALVPILFWLLVVSAFIFWVRMLVDCATKESDEGNTKIVWILIIILTHVFGAILYWAIRRPKRDYADMIPAHSRLPRL